MTKSSLPPRHPTNGRFVKAGQARQAKPKTAIPVQKSVSKGTKKQYS